MLSVLATLFLGDVVRKFAPLAGAAIALALIVAPAAADLQQDVAICNGDVAGASLDQKIASCTAVVESGRYSGANLGYVYVNRANAYDDKGDHDRALSDYNRSIELNPNNASAFFNRALAYARKADYDRAISDYNRAIAINPKYAHAMVGRAVMYSVKGDYDTAIANCTQAIAIEPTYVPAYLNRGRAWAKKNDLQKALADFKKVVELDPSNQVGQQELANTRKALGQ
jgi:tetratricopeptide (TPR) repeat protein